MTLAGRYARLVVRARWWIVAAWAAAAVAAVVALPSIEHAQSGAPGDLVPADAEAVEVERRSAELFAFPLLARTVVVQRDPEGLPPSAYLRAGSRAVALNRGEVEGLTGIAGAIPVFNAPGELPFARERGTAALTFLLFPADIGPSGQGSLTRHLIEREVSAPADALVGATGAIPARAEQRDLIGDALPLVELATVVLVALAVGLHFRAWPAPLVNLAAVAIAYVIATRVAAGIGTAVDVSVPREVEPVIVVLLFGILTDYSIFMLSRFRSHVGAGLDRLAAAQRTSEEMTGIIVTAGVAVAGASGSLAAAELGFLKAFGPGVAVAVLIGMAVAITFVPAVLAILGGSVFAPSHPGRATPPPPREHRMTSLAARRPRLVLAVAGAVLLAASAGALRLDVGQTLIRGLPEGSEPREAYFDAARAFVPGILSPTVVLVEAPGVTRRRAELRDLQRRIEELPGVAAAVGPREQRLGQDLGAVYADNGGAARIAVVAEDDPLGAAAIATLRRLERRLSVLAAVSGLGDAQVRVAGDTALAAETIAKARTDIARVAPLALAAVLLVLAFLLRALVAPLYLALASVLGLCAALGLTVFLFQDILGYGELTFYVPFAAAVLLLALGSDYNVFIAGRVWQVAQRRPLREAIVEAGASAARPITVAGIVLAASFALLALVPVRPFRELAFMMAVGLALDAFVVRTLLVPALISAVGRASGWPAPERSWPGPRDAGQHP